MDVISWARKPATIIVGSRRNLSNECGLSLIRKVGLSLLLLAPFAISQDRPIFTAEADLQSIAVQVTDRQGRAIRGLTADDFTLLEDGHPQKISFFGAEEQPISLAVLVDSSESMRFGNKLERVREILPPLLRGNLPADEIYFAQFTDHVLPMRPLAEDERAHPIFRQVHAGTAFYDALATALCTLRGASNLRQAVVVITDGADQHSRLSLDQLIRTAQASRPQIFTIGFFDNQEADLFRRSGNVVTLVNSRDIDNPLKAFERISQETGAESFFPASQRDMEHALTRIQGILRAQYTLAYHTERPNSFRRIQVKVKRPGVVVSARRAVGSEAGEGGIAHFSATGCEVSSSEHPYPWESHVTHSPDGLVTYEDDFSDPRSGWPVRRGLRYALNSPVAAGGPAGAYEISIPPPAKNADLIPEEPRRIVRNPATASEIFAVVNGGEIAAYGPSFTDFRASVRIEAHPAFYGGGGLIFRLSDRGYYVLVLQRGGGFRTTDSRHDPRRIAFSFVRKFWDGRPDAPIIDWTALRPPGPPKAKTDPVSPWDTASVECTANHIAVRINGIPCIDLNDGTFADGEVGLAFFGYGRALFHDLKVEELK